MHGKDFVGIADLDSARLIAVLERAVRLKHDRRVGRPHPLLPGRTVALLFEKPSLRTRVSFEVGVGDLGGRALYLSPAEVGLGQRETPADVARVLSSERATTRLDGCEVVVIVAAPTGDEATAETDADADAE